jgi:hypothetical protein
MSEGVRQRRSTGIVHRRGIKQRTGANRGIVDVARDPAISQNFEHWEREGVAHGICFS